MQSHLCQLDHDDKLLEYGPRPSIDLQSDLDSTRGLGVPDFRKFSAYNRGPRSKEVDQMLTSFYSKSSWHRFWRANHILELSVVSAMPQKMLTWLHDAQAWSCYVQFEHVRNFSQSSFNFESHYKYILKIYREVKVGSLTNNMTRFYSQDRFLKCPANLSLISLSRSHPWGIYIFLMKLDGQDPSSSCMS
jgi:hypothetical protein